MTYQKLRDHASRSGWKRERKNFQRNVAAIALQEAVMDTKEYLTHDLRSAIMMGKDCDEDWRNTRPGDIHKRAIIARSRIGISEMGRKSLGLDKPENINGPPLEVWITNLFLKMPEQIAAGRVNIQNVSADEIAALETERDGNNSTPIAPIAQIDQNAQNNHKNGHSEN